MNRFRLVVLLLVLLGLVAGTASSGSRAGKRLATPSVSRQPNADGVVPSTTTRKVAEPVDQDAATLSRTLTPSKSERVPVQLTMPKSPIQVSGFTGDVLVGTGNTFVTINSVIQALNFGAQVSGNTRFLLTDASYTEAGFVLGTITYGPGGPFTVTFQPKAGSTGVTVNLTKNASGGGAWVMDSVSHVTIEGQKADGTPGGACGDPSARLLTIVLTGDSSSSVVRVRDGSTNVTIADCNIVGLEGPVSGTTGINLTTDSSPQTDITIQNCRIHDQRTGIASVGLRLVLNSTDEGNWDQRIKILGCDIGTNVAQFGIFLQQSTQDLISCNSIHDVAYPATYAASSARTAGIFGNNFTHSTVIKNTIDHILNLNSAGGTAARVYGIRGDAKPIGESDTWSLTFSNNRYVNNCITRIQGSGLVPGFRDFGIEAGQGRRDTLYYNTVYLTGLSNATGTSDGSSCYQTFGNRGALFAGFTVAGARTCLQNNLFVNTRDAGTGLTEHTALRPFNDGGATDIQGNSDFNVYYSPTADGEVDPGDATIAQWKTDAARNIGGADIHSLGYNPFMLAANDCHWDATLASSASNTGKVIGGVTDDLVGTARNATTPDIGAVEEAPVAPLFHDAYMVSILNPPPSGLAQGLPFSGAQAVIANNTQNGETAAGLSIKIYDPTMAQVFSGTATSGGLAAFGFDTLTTTGAFTPAVPGTFTIVAIVTLTGDGDHSNDTITNTFPVAPLTAVSSGSPYCTTFETPGENAGWFGDGDFVLGTPAKVRRNDENNTPQGGFIQGAHSGSNAWVTNLTDISGNGATTINNLYTPFFDLRTLGTGYLSFFHFIATEPVFDGTDMEYSIDTGKTWKVLGTVNDPNGVNWYDSTVYTNITDKFGVFDFADAATVGFAGPPTFWTSNGFVGFNNQPNPLPPGDSADAPSGPFGYVFAQIKLPADAVGKNYVRFRYRYFSDPSGESDGAAVDDFCIKATPSTFTGSICGVKFDDKNGNGVQNAGELGESGIKLLLAYFGTFTGDTATTDGTGHYCFNNLKPGNYSITPINPAGTALSSPNTIVNDGVASQNLPIGDFTGSISGVKYNDKHRNGTKDGDDAVLSGWTIELHKDSCNGALLTKAITPGDGSYKFSVTPGHYYLREVQQTGWIQTEPGNNCTSIIIDTVSNSPGSVKTGVNFGNWKKGSIRLEKVVDLNGNGIKEAGDVTAMPNGATAKFYLKKNGITIDSVTLGNTALNVTEVLDTGSYSFTEATMTPGWIRTFPASATVGFLVDTSATTQVISFGNFKMVTLSGTKYEDKNGNGTRDSAEGGLAGWTINVRGGLFFGGTSAVTDSNGNWSIDSCGGPKDTLTEVGQAGWTETAPASGQIVATISSGNDQTGLNFGNFRNVTVSGYKYRDRNANHTRDGGEEGLGGWQINMTGPGGGSIVTDSTGFYTYPSVGPGAHIMTETPQVGWTQTEPIAGNYTFSATSGVNQTTGRNFGNFNLSDSSNLYRTFTIHEFENGAGFKKTKPAKTGKPFVAPNLTTLLYDYVKQFGLTSEIQVGVASVLNAGGKVKAYVQPKSYTDVLKTFNDKGVMHTGSPDSIYRGLDFNNKAKQMLKRFKSLSPKVQRNTTLAQLMALSVNISLSDAAKTPAGLANIIFDDGAADAYCGMTISQVLAAGSNVMTNFEFVPLSTYQRLAEVASKINGAFSCGGAACGDSIQPFVFDTASWTGTAKVLIAGTRPVAGIPYLRANSQAVPVTAPKPSPIPLPDVYSLYQNYPNPFNPTTTIDFDLPGDALVTLKIYNILGQEMGTLFSHEALDAGQQEVDFDATNLPSGVYFYRLVAEKVNDDGAGTGQTFTQVKKMMLIK